MAKTAIILFIILIIVSALSGAYFSLTDQVTLAQESDLTDNQTDHVEVNYETITSVLEEAGKNIQDREIARYYWKLLQEYELESPSLVIEEDEPSSPAVVIPDIEKINHAAITLPLQEAGRNIQDKEIAEFYYRFLNGAGWNIEPD